MSAVGMPVTHSTLGVGLCHDNAEYPPCSLVSCIASTRALASIGRILKHRQGPSLALTCVWKSRHTQSPGQSSRRTPITSSTFSVRIVSGKVCSGPPSSVVQSLAATPHRTSDSNRRHTSVNFDLKTLYESGWKLTWMSAGGVLCVVPVKRMPSRSDGSCRGAPCCARILTA